MPAPRRAGGLIQLVGIGSSQYDLRSRDNRIGTGPTAAAPAAGVISMAANGALSAPGFPTFCHNTDDILALHAPNNGIYVFDDIDPASTAGLSFVGSMAGAADPNNLLGVARVWALHQLRTPQGIDWVGRYQFTLALTVGNLAVPARSNFLPLNNVDQWKWCDAMALSGADRSMAPGVRFTGDDVDCMATAWFDALGCRGLIVQVVEGAATPVDALVPVLSQV